uniref:THAP-type domain-containing protein n=2 Tax=Amphimedon queenslandica TaxID=400682 RepID=A0A1X7VLZ0_AMPQE
MPIHYSAFGCNNRQGLRNVSFYCFPADPELRQQWVTALNRKNWKPTSTSRLCSTHFVGSKRSNNPLSVSYVPTIFTHTSVLENSIKQFSDRSSRFINHRRRQNKVIQKRVRKTAIVHKERRVQVTEEEVVSEEEVAEEEAAEEEVVAEENQDVSLNTQGRENDIDVSEGNAEENDVEEADDQGELHGTCDDELNELAGVPFDDEHEDDEDQSEEGIEYGTQNEESNVLSNCEEMLEDCEYEILQLQLDKEVLDKEVLDNHLEKQKQDIANLSSMYDRCSKALRTSASNTQKLTSHLQKIEFRARSFQSDKKIRFYTGLPTFAVFSKLFRLLSTFVEKPLHSKLDLMDELLITLAKLRRGYENQDLAYRVGIDVKYISTIFHRWLDLLYRKFKQLIMWPNRIALKHNLPKCFRGKYVNAVCIIDCFEVFMQTPSLLAAQTATYSHYKHHNNVKFLIGITPTGSIYFVSQAWGGRSSDKVITRHCGILDNFEYGDVVLADRGFNISDELAICGAHLCIPAFTKGRDQLSRSEVEKTRQLANVRIHVERVIGQLKNFKILQSVLPIRLIKKPDDTTVCTIDKIVTVAAAITNLSKPII